MTFFQQLEKHNTEEFKYFISRADAKGGCPHENVFVCGLRGS